MELFAKRMSWELDNEEGLSCLFFELEDGYFTLSRKTGAEALRLEMNDPANGQLIDPDCFEYALDNTRFRLNIVRTTERFCGIWKNTTSTRSCMEKLSFTTLLSASHSLKHYLP